MALLLETKINKDGTWVMTPDDARELAECLKYAADESEDHESIWPILVGGFVCGHNHFYINVNPHKHKKVPVYVPPTPSTIEIVPRRPLWKRIFGIK